MPEHTQSPTAEEERRREERRSPPSQAKVPPSPPADKHDVARGREKLERILAK
jgi:hypothetical protein